MPLPSESWRASPRARRCMASSLDAPRRGASTASILTRQSFRSRRPGSPETGAGADPREPHGSRHRDHPPGQPAPVARLRTPKRLAPDGGAHFARTRPTNGRGSVCVSFAPVQHCPPPVARASSGQVKGGDGFLRMPASRFGKRVGCRATQEWYRSPIRHCPFLGASWERRHARRCAQTRRP